ncbi:MAG: hypothetical protein HQL51_02585 [Magnetococcales bacterium]|nr:hypothetical protein [Magnetococcales bacterium]
MCNSELELLYHAAAAESTECAWPPRAPSVVWGSERYGQKKGGRGASWIR